MVEWHIDPVYIVDNWTMELLNLMIRKMADRTQAANRRAKYGGDMVSGESMLNFMKG